LSGCDSFVDRAFLGPPNFTRPRANLPFTPWLGAMRMQFHTIGGLIRVNSNLALTKNKRAGARQFSSSLAFRIPAAPLGLSAPLYEIRISDINF